MQAFRCRGVGAVGIHLEAALLLQVSRFRAEFINPNKLFRMAEPCIMIVLFVTLSMVLPLFFPCTPTQVTACACPCSEICCIEPCSRTRMCTWPAPMSSMFT